MSTNHSHGGTDAPECTTCRPTAASSPNLRPSGATQTAETPGGGGLTEAERHPFYLAVAHRHDDERVCLYNANTNTWYIEGGPGSGRTRHICDREHPDPRDLAAAVQARAEVVARVEALADEWADGGREAGRMGYVNAIRAALAGPNPSEDS